MSCCPCTTLEVITSDDIGYFLQYSAVSQELPEGLVVHAVKYLFIVHKVDIPLQGLFQDDKQRGNLVSATPILTKTSLLLTKLWVYGILLSKTRLNMLYLCNRSRS